MPAYNSGRFIEQSIRSVLSQTYTDWELLVVDDCSTDDTTSIVASFKDKRIHYQRNEHNMGAALSRNKAIQAAKGKYIAFLDADDKWLPTKLEKQVGFMQKNNIPMSYTAYYIQHPTHTDYCIHQCPTTQNYYQLTKWNRIGCLTVMYDARVVGLIQIADIKKNNDYAMWLKVIHKTRCYLLPECLAKYRRGRVGSISTHSYSALIKWHYRLFREADNKGRFSSAILTFVNLCFGCLKKIVYVKK